MPTATSFQAKGRRNGFPFCPGKVDVSTYSNWITLGGYDKTTAGAGTSVTQDQIDESLVNSMKLWWNLYSITGSFSVSSTNSVEGNLSVSATNHELILKRSGESDALTPVQRACRGTSFSTNDLQSIFIDTSTNTNGTVEGKLFIGGLRDPGFIIRMYDGSTDSESNFVGYGVSRLGAVSTFASNRSVLGSVDITVGSFLNGINESGVDPDTGITFDVKVFQTTLGGIPFRSKTFANADEFGGSLSLSTSELSGSATANSIIPSPISMNTSVNVSASLSSIDFYTYS